MSFAETGSFSRASQSDADALVQRSVKSSSAHDAAWRAVAFAAAISALTAATLGYDVGIMAAAIDYISDTMNLNDVQTQLVVGSLNFISAFGTLIAGQSSDRLGRKTTVWICCGLYILGTACMALAPNYYILLVGRVVTGLGVGVSFVVVPVYISEITPSEARGMLTTCFDVSINMGIVLGYIIGFLVVDLGTSMTKEIKWRLMIAIGGTLPIIVVLSLSYLPESPRWLMSKGRSKEATIVMEKFLGDPILAQEAITSIKEMMKEDGGYISDDDDDDNNGDNNLVGRHNEYDRNNEESKNDEEINVENSIQAQRETVQALPNVPNSRALPLTWREILRLDPLPKSEQYLNSVVFLVVCVGFWQQSTGSEAILYYSSVFLERAGLKSTKERLLGYVLIGFCKLIPEAASMFLVDSMGRRPLLLISSYGLTASMFLIAVVFMFPSNSASIFIVVLLSIFMIFFSIGVGPITWLLASEMLPLRARAKGMTLGSFTNRLISGTVALSALSTCDALGYSGFFALYGTMGILGSIWYVIYIPETKGKTLEEITAMFKETYSPKMRRSDNYTATTNPVTIIEGGGEQQTIHSPLSPSP
mmetsp:Transcript_37420/g.48415  ORF Transcript_37420/g.48415 Transcript_37420/m.48415 type:complete len:591 (+) Transcript_37420:3-1775(+)